SLVYHANAALFLLFVVASILQIIYRKTKVSRDSLYGAFCGYLLLGLAFGHLHCLEESLNPGAFRGDEDLAPRLANDDTCHAVLTYYSFTTITTLGLGDITPRSPLARDLAWIEAVMGQFYLAVVMAELIGMKVALAVSPRGEGPEE